MKAKWFNFGKAVSLRNAPWEVIPKHGLADLHPAVRFGTYWRSLNGGKIPHRKTFVPNQIKDMLKWIMVFERASLNGLGDYLLRLHGTAMVAMAHGDFTGKRLQDFTKNDCLASRQNTMRKAIETGEPVYGRAVSGGDSAYRYEVMFGCFPFKCDNDTYQVFILGAPTNTDLMNRL